MTERLPLAEPDRPVSILFGSRLVVGVCGGVAAYKAIALCSMLVQAGAAVDVVLTQSALDFVTSRAFNAITRRIVHAGSWEPWTLETAGHVSLAQEADALLIVPTTAHTIARLALGLADDALGTVALATTAPLLVAPAMEHAMWHHPATEQHVATLRSRGATIVSPEAGRLASGQTGDGRLAPLEHIVGTLRGLLGRHGSLAGKRVIVTAGPTQEPLDPVRYLGNRSSGHMGLAITQQLLDRGASVHLVVGPISAAFPSGADVTAVRTAAEMMDATQALALDADALIMAAAVADFRPATISSAKIKKGAKRGALALQLTQNPDILASLNTPGMIKIGFAAETNDLLFNARAKLTAKGLAMIVANDAAATIGSDRSTATLLRADGTSRPLPNLSKDELGSIIADELVSLLVARDRGMQP